PYPLHAGSAAAVPTRQTKPNAAKQSVFIDTTFRIGFPNTYHADRSTRRRENNWRMGWDSNPRDPCGPAGFQDRCLQPLGHPSFDRLTAYISRPTAYRFVPLKLTLSKDVRCGASTRAWSLRLAPPSPIPRD